MPKFDSLAIKLTYWPSKINAIFDFLLTLAIYVWHLQTADCCLLFCLGSFSDNGNAVAVAIFFLLKTLNIMLYAFFQYFSPREWHWPLFFPDEPGEYLPHAGSHSAFTSRRSAKWFRSGNVFEGFVPTVTRHFGVCNWRISWNFWVLFTVLMHNT